MKIIRPFVLYCHGLGASPYNKFAQRAKELAESRQLNFKSVLYRNVGTKKLWDVDEWLEDILTEIDALKQNGVSKTILFGFSGGCHGVLHAAVKRQNDICGLFLMAPGVGLHLESYVANAMPDAIKELLAGKALVYPAVKDGFPALINHDCLLKYSEKCLSNTLEKIPIRCPVRVLHGATDEIVPLNSVEQFLKKLESTDVDYRVLPEVGHYIPMSKDVEELFDSLLAAIPKSLNV